MKKKRIVSVLLLMNGWLVQSKRFNSFKNLGNPLVAVERLSQWAADELIYLDISRDSQFSELREDLAYKGNRTFLDIVSDVSEKAFMPITIGGKIRSSKDVEGRLSRGADKVSINTLLVSNMGRVYEMAKEFGSQCIVASIDGKKVGDEYRAFVENGERDSGYSVAELARMAENNGVGEIFLNSIDRDGCRNGYDINFIKNVTESVGIPVIACGGVGDWDDFDHALLNTKADAVAAANIFHYTDQSVYHARKHLYEKGRNVRPPEIMSIRK